MPEGETLAWVVHTLVRGIFCSIIFLTMPIYKKEEISPLHFNLSIQLEPSDYQAEYEAELNKYRKQASLKGFRKGKTPTSVLRKMFGRSILAEVLNKELQEAITQYFRQENLNMLGNPIPSEDNDTINLDAGNLHQYAFKFEVGVAPKVEIHGVGPDSTYERFEVEITDEMVSNHLTKLQERFANLLEPESDFLSTDRITWAAVELEGDAPKVDGKNFTFSTSIDQIKNEDLLNKVMAAKVGDTFRVEIKNTFDVTPETLHGWMDVREERFPSVSDWFDINIKEVLREENAELGQEFYDKAFGTGKVSNEEEARSIIRSDFFSAYLPVANSLVFVEIRERIMRETSFELPEAFLKKWMAYNNEELTPEKIEEGFGKFLESLRWSIVRNQLAAEYKIEVTEEEIEAQFIKNIRQYFGNSPFINNEFLHNMAHRLMEDEAQVNQVYEEIFTENLFSAILLNVTVVSKPISLEDFEAEVQKSRARLKSETETEIPEITAEVETVGGESSKQDGE